MQWMRDMTADLAKGEEEAEEEATWLIGEQTQLKAESDIEKCKNI